MCTFRERVNELNKKVEDKVSFVEKMNEMSDTMRKWVAADLHEITKASIWTILYNWADGRSKPCKMQQEAIAIYFESTCEKLFP